MYELSDYKRKLKPLILQEAERSFCEKGIRAVKMDDIARRLGISKRTLYEIYSNKEEVLVDVVSKLLSQRDKLLSAFAEKCDNAMDILLEALRLQVKFSAQTHSDFFKDMQRYPAAEKLIDEYAVKQEHNTFIFYEKGISQGYFLSEIDYRLLHTITSSTVHRLRSDLKYNNLTYKQLFVNYFAVIIRGICTVKGLERFDEFLKQVIDG